MTECDGVDEMPLPFVADQRADVDDHRRAARQPVLGVDVDGGQPVDAIDVDSVVNHDDAGSIDAVVDEDVADRAGRGDESVHLPVLPLREGMALQVKVDAARGDQLRPWCWCAKGEGQSGHRHGVRVVRVDDRRLPLPDEPRQLPGGRQIDVAFGRERNEVASLGGATKQLAVGMGDEHGSMAPRPQPEDGQEGLLLSSAPGARRVDVEGEHSSQSLANFSPT